MDYEIQGRVVEQNTSVGIGYLRVEAWDKDPAVDDFLGSAVTSDDGSFTIKFDETWFREFFIDHSPDIYFRVFHEDDLVASTEDSVIWNAGTQVNVTIPIPPIIKKPCKTRHIYLKIERIDHYSPVRPQDKVVPPVQYGRDCMRNEGHENGFIPEAEIQARSLEAVVYREYLDSAYLIPKPDKLILADINEPAFNHRVPGTVIYTRPCQILKIHVWNCDDGPHSLHVHGLRYGIDSDGSWPFGTQAAHHGGRSDAICPGESWTYTFEVTDEMYGVWPFHDHTHHMDMKIDHGLFGGFVVLRPGDKPPRPFKFPPNFIGKFYAELEKLEGRPLLEKRTGFVEEEDNPDAFPILLAPHIHIKRLKPESRRFVKDQLDFLDEFAEREIAIRPRNPPTDHVPVFFHLMSGGEGNAAFDSGDLEEFVGVFEHTFVSLGDFEYFCQHHPVMTGTVHVVAAGPMTATVNIVDGPPMTFSPDDITVGIGATVRWENHSMHHHTVTATEGASIPTHCINGRGFVGNSPTIEARSGQRIRWYVFNLDTGLNWHNFHPHAMRWKFAGENIDIRSIGPAESFVVDAQVPPVLLLEGEAARMQDPEHRPEDAKLYHLKGDFVFHCHVHHHMMNGMVGLVRARQSVWLTPDVAHEISHQTGLPLDNSGNDCPDVDPHPCMAHGAGRWEEIAGNPEVSFMHSVLLPNTTKVLFWGYTRVDQSRLWDYSTPAGVYSTPANQPATLPGQNINTSDMWSAEHALLDTPEGLVLIHGGFSPDRAFTFDPGTLAWSEVAATAQDRFYSTTLLIDDGRALTLFGSASKSIEAYTHGVGWAAPLAMPISMNHHQYYPWTYLLPDGRLFIGGPHDPSQRFDWTAPAGVESFATIGGNRSTGGEKGTSVLLILRPPDYRPIVYIMGGNTPTTEQTVEQIDASVPIPAWVAAPNLNVARAQQVNSVLLPDGRILLAGGVAGADGGPCEIFDPRNPGLGWQLGPNMQYVRGYHSSFLLLSDGSVLGGGDPAGAGGQPTPHERFFPDYYDMLRPVITSAPATVSYGATFTVDTPTPADIGEVILLRPGAVTHGFNMSQRGIECVISAFGAGSIDVASPPNANLAPPGWYLLFVLSASRIPSQGRWIRLTP